MLSPKVRLSADSNRGKCLRLLALFLKINRYVVMLADFLTCYNFARPQKTSANPYSRTPAMAANLTDHVWSIEEIVELKVKNAKKGGVA
jgi:hypothetical protein